MNTTRLERGAGVLCHISSLPNEYGIGSLGREAYEFVDTLVKYGVKYWQILPLQQTGFGDSPYQSVSCTSGNPYFIDPEELLKQGLIDREELESSKIKLKNDVDYGALYQKRYALLRRAYARFNIKNKDFVEFIESGEAEDYALFMSLKSRYNGDFSSFPEAYKYKEHLAMYEFRNAVYREEYCFWLFLQYEFKKQWKALRAYANAKGVKIIGDIPLYVAYDSADVWARPELFQLDEELKPTKVAGVPPDYFSKTGQLWGNPLYNWDAMRAQKYDWWIDRIAKAQEMYDVVRIDHFRGLDRYYAIPADAETAIDGEWCDGPKLELFAEAEKRLGNLCVIAEDLGVMDDGVIALRDNTGFPGMKIMMFAFGGDDSDYLPQNVTENSVTYTGTHDNDTSLGFLLKMDDEQFAQFKKRLRAALRYEGVYMPIVDRADAAEALVLCALNTKSDLAIIPVQDILRMDNAARMNEPSTTGENWKFRLTKMPSRNKMAVFKNLIKRSGR
ncbi:MAG: 4-alpha-glucanotransferase [Candidatus Coproplasma sp.]